MATLVLSAVGTAIGGPLGGVLGALLGQGVDARLLSPKGRRGPRLQDLRVQTSSYGAPIPRLYGRMRVAGTVIWATDLVEHRGRQSNGKGRGSSTTYSYSVSLAVALSSPPIAGVGRIWAEGNLLRGGDGAFKSPVVFRLHHGGEDQAVDPLIAAAEGPGQAPAFRGLAYAVFEDLDLTPFGNRVPSLTFEVEADAGDVPLTAPFGDMLGDVEAGEPVPDLTGCALVGETCEAAIAPFLAMAPVARRPGGGWTVGTAPTPVAMLGEATGKRQEARTAGDDAVPRQVTLSLFDPARDFQVGEQSARVAGGGGAATRIALPAAMTASAAKQQAIALAGRAATSRRQVDWPGGWAAIAVPVGRAARLPGESLPMRVTERRIDGEGVLLSLRALGVTVAGAGEADGGRAIIAPDLAVGTTRAALFDLPAMRAADLDTPRLVLAARGGAGWRGGRVTLRASEDAPAVELGVARPVELLGVVEAMPAYRGAALIDRAGAMIVALDDPLANLIDCSDADQLAGANLAMAGDEVVQFGAAEPLGGGRWRLSTLLRARFGTDAAAATEAAGRPFTLLSDADLFPIPAQAGIAATVVGGIVSVQGAADPAPVEIEIGSIGRASRPMAPVHARAAWRDDGGLDVAWIRASRLGLGWNDGVDASLDHRFERYRIDWAAGGAGGSRETAEPAIGFAGADVAALRSAGSLLALAIVQLGDGGASDPLHLNIALN